MVEHTRTLDFKIAFAIGLGTMIAAGIFSLSGTAVAAIGSSAVVAFVIAALVAGITAAAYSEFASVYSENGGGYLFCSRTFEDRDLLTYGIGMSLFLGYTGTTAFYLATMDEWFFAFIIPESFHVLPHGSVGVAAAVLLGALNARGTEESGGFQLLVTSAKVAVLFVFIAGAVAFAGPASATRTFATGFQVEPVNIASIAALAFITFFGFSAIAASAGEIIEPRKTVPRAIAASMVTVTVLYALVIVAMVNAPVPDSVLEQGETAMGTVAASFLGPAGQYLIVAGAVFSMVSASNASILAASGIGSLMGRRGQAPRRFARIHPDHGTPYWAIVAATGLIVTLIVAFIAVFSADGGLAGLRLGLGALTGFATFNLLVPLAVVNVALVASRRKSPDLTRGFRMPAVPVLPALGVVANLALIYQLPRDGAAAGAVIVVGGFLAYRAWGGAPAVEDLVREVVPAGGPTAEAGATASANGGDRFEVLVAVARPGRARAYVALAARLAAVEDGAPLVRVLNVTHVPDQTPSEMAVDTAEERADRLETELEPLADDVEFVVEGHVCRDVAFDILQTAREENVDRIVMGYPEERPGVVETVEYEAPCDVLFVRGIPDSPTLSTVNVGAGGGPHHRALLPVVDGLCRRGTDVHVVNVDPGGGGGSPEDTAETVDRLEHCDDVTVHEVDAATVADGLVSTAAENGGFLLIGATRDRRLRRWVFGSTPDRVIDLAEDADVPVVIFAASTGVPARVEDYVYPVYRYLRRLYRGRGSYHSGPSRSPLRGED